MKKLLLLILILFANSSYCNYLVITDLTSTTVPNGINVNVKTFSGTVTGYISSSYTINDNIIELSLCYWISDALLATNLENDFSIPLNNSGNYTINVTAHMSTSNEICDDFIIADTETLNVPYLVTGQFENNDYHFTLLPNPTNGVLKSNKNLKINQLEVFDNCGRLVKQVNALENNTLDLSQLVDGIYFIKIETESKNSVQKIIIKK